MNGTSGKAKKEMKKKLSEFTDSAKSDNDAPKTNKQKKMTTSKKKQTTISDKSDEMKFDKNIQMLLENNNSEYDNISKDDISVGSIGKKKDNTTKDKESSSRHSKKNKKEPIDFSATISVGSMTKGKKPTLNIGGTK